MRANLTDETWVPLKWIWTIVGSCAVSICTLIGAVWYIASLASHEEVAAAQIMELTKRQDSSDEDRKIMTTYMQSIDGRLSRIEGYLRRKSQ